MTATVSTTMPAPTIGTCRACALREGCRSPVPPAGSMDAPILIIGDAPGRAEDKWGAPFMGPGGQETDEYLRRVGMSRNSCRLFNVVHCRPPDDRDPSLEELRACRPWLEREILESSAAAIATMGAHACRAVIGPDFDLEVGHGIPQRVDFCGKQIIVVPLYHPNYGLHSTSMMSRISDDFAALASTVRGQVSPDDFADEIPDPHYELVTGAAVAAYCYHSPLFVDTETHPDGSPWCVNFTGVVGEGYVVLAKDTEGIAILRDAMNDPERLIVMHHAKFDINVLLRLGIDPPFVADSMEAAYLLQKEPQGLKALAYRHASMYMKNYSDIVDPYTRQRAKEYMEMVGQIDWPPPEPVVVWEKGLPRIKTPQKLATKVKRILTDMGKSDDVDPMDRWQNIEPETRELVECVVGPLVPCDLSDVPLDDSIWYAGRDADATARVWNTLWQSVQDAGLEDTFWVDMAVIRMTLDMEKAGMGVDLSKFAALSAYYQHNMDRLSGEINVMLGKEINPGSTYQVADALYHQLGIVCPKTTKKGAESTDTEALLTIIHEHPVIKLIMDWKGLQKNKTSFADAIPGKVARDGRLHANIKTTRVYTGRLACDNPNLMAMPVRSEEGVKIRTCFVSAPGRTIVSGDYGQIEMRLVGHASQDAEMLRVFRAGEDIHIQTASRIFGLPADRLDAMKHRYPAKRVGFGVMNHLTAEGLMDQLVLAGCDGWTLDRCDELIREWFRIFSGVKTYFDHTKAHARQKGYVVDQFGRRYLVPEVRSSLKHIREAGERQACSYVVQGGAQGVMKRGMIQMVPAYREFQAAGYYCWPLMQIHDDLIWEVDDEILDIFIPLFKDTMEHAVPLSLPLEVEVKTGTDWGTMEKLKGGGDE